MSRILIVEDELQMQMGLKDNLEFEGYEVECANDGEEGLAKILESAFDLILLDVMMPKLSGFDVCKKAREAGIETPVIMLTAKGEEIDKVLGLELGADDYITKPFSLRELLARVKANIRRGNSTNKNQEVSHQVGKLQFNPASYESLKEGQPVTMSHKEMEVLKYLWDHQSKTVSRDSLLENVWGYDEMVTSRTVDNFILRLRQKIEENPAHPRHILTVHGVGYKLIP
jgi:YD repeat-containing protein